MNDFIYIFISLFISFIVLHYSVDTLFFTGALKRFPFMDRLFLFPQLYSGAVHPAGDFKVGCALQPP